MAALCSAQMILYGPLAGLSIYFTHFFAIFLQKPRKNAVFPVDSVKKAGFALKSSGFLLYAHLYAGHALRFFDIASCYNQRDENGNMWKFEKGRERSSADMTKARAGVCWPRRCARARSFLRHTPRGACSRAERGRGTNGALNSCGGSAAPTCSRAF